MKAKNSGEMVSGSSKKGSSIVHGATKFGHNPASCRFKLPGTVSTHQAMTRLGSRGLNAPDPVKQSKRKKVISISSETNPNSSGIREKRTEKDSLKSAMSNIGGSRQMQQQQLLNKSSATKSLGGGPSPKGFAVQTSSQEGMMVGSFRDRKRKSTEMETKSKYYSAESKRAIVTGNYSLASLSFCGICMEKKIASEMFKSGCLHVYCRACVGSHVAAKIRDNVIKVKCPDPNCRVFVEPQHCRSFVARGVIERWEAALCEAALGSKKMYCPFRDCSAVLYIEDGQRNVTSAECPYCHRLFCAQCCVPWHAGSQCKSKLELLDKKFVELAGKEKWQKCANCKFYVQRTDGCESMKCRCGYNFCYMCGGGWQFGHLCAARR